MRPTDADHGGSSPWMWWLPLIIPSMTAVCFQAVEKWSQRTRCGFFVLKKGRGAVGNQLHIRRWYKELKAVALNEGCSSPHFSLIFFVDSRVHYVSGAQIHPLRRLRVGQTCLAMVAQNESDKACFHRKGTHQA